MLEPAPTAAWSIEEAAHLLNRAGFGAPPATLREWYALGRAAAVDKLTTPSPSPETPARPAWFSQEKYKELVIAVRDERMALMAEGGTTAQQQARQRQLKKNLQDRQQATEAVGWWLDRLHAAPAPLTEKMTLFWHGHFATSIEKVKDPYLMLQQNELFRSHALGNIRTLTKTVVRDPAMMIYLDTDKSLRTKPNENFAREVMELFTLGEGEYTEDDIKEAARAFTGLKINRLLGRSFFHEPSWDAGEKSILGHRGRHRSDDVVDILFRQPACARFLAAKLCAHFISDAPSDKLIAAVAECLRQHDFELTPVLRTLFLSAEFYAPVHRRAQIKSPVQFLVQTRHALGLASLPRPLQLGILQQLGQNLFRPPNVAGWDGGRAWINTNTLLARYNIAGFLVKGPSGGYRPPMVTGRNAAQVKNRHARDRLARQLASKASVDLASMVPPDLRHDRTALIQSLSERLFHTSLDADTRRPFEEYLAGQGESEVSDAVLANLIHLMMSTPHYQLC
ncbi:MAG: DUF1800 family protein [Verrucomicrobiales bacterium]